MSGVLGSVDCQLLCVSLISLKLTADISATDTEGYRCIKKQEQTLGWPERKGSVLKSIDPLK